MHGADAVAGVVNLVTRQPAPGGELGVSYGNAFGTDAAERRATLALGARPLEAGTRESKNVNRSVASTAGLCGRLGRSGHWEAAVVSSRDRFNDLSSAGSALRGRTPP